MHPVATRSSQQTIEQFDRYVIPNYKRYPVCIVHGEGSRVWDAEGKEYLDLFPGWGCNLLGHAPQKVVKAVQQQLEHLIHVPNTWYTEQQGDFAEALSTRSFGKAFFANSGAEANEAAIKLARLYGAPNRFRIITCYNSFHGRTLGAVTATAQPKYHEGLGPLLPGFRYAPYNDLDAIANLVDDETCAVMLEPIQGEGGVNIASNEFLQGLRALCDERKLLLIFDEVQTGMGRTGKWFAYQHTGIQPDVMTLAKALGSGVACGAMLCRDELAPVLRPGMHASTFGGNSVAMAAGIATIRTIEEEGLLARAERLAERLHGFFQSLQSELPIIKEIRVRGVMLGVELSIPASAAVGKCMERGVLINVTHDTVVRLLPALNIPDADLDAGCAVIADVLREIAHV